MFTAAAAVHGEGDDGVSSRGHLSSLSEILLPTRRQTTVFTHADISHYTVTDQ